MAYEKQGFYSGEKLKASQLNAMEDGIVNAETVAMEAKELAQAGGGSGGTKLYRHSIELNTNSGSSLKFVIINSKSTELTGKDLYDYAVDNAIRIICAVNWYNGPDDDVMDGVCWLDITDYIEGEGIEGTMIGALNNGGGAYGINTDVTISLRDGTYGLFDIVSEL